MPHIESKLNPRSEDFKANAAAMQAVVDDLRARIAQIAGFPRWMRASCS